jgi:N-acyl-D-amino-acid deacylase
LPGLASFGALFNSAHLPPRHLLPATCHLLPRIAMSCDLIIANGTIVDGTGEREAFVGDVAVKDGKICAVGSALGDTFDAARTIDATGKHILPGWTDIHTHFDTQCMWDPQMSPSGASGVTTVVMGNCGVGAAPTRKEGREFMMNILGVVEDIPVAVMREGVQWEVNGKEWESFPEWMDALDQLPFAVDVAAMVPHSAVRPYVLGLERCNVADRKGGPVDNPLTLEEKQAIADCVKEGIACGAVGFSTSRFTGHRDSTGQLAPGSLADADEMIMIAKGMAEAGGGMLEMVNDFSSYDDIPLDKLDPTLRKEHFEREQDWIHFVAKEYGIPVNWADIPTAPGGKGGDNSFLEGCQAEGLPVCRQMIIRPQALIFSWRSRMHPFSACPTFKSIQQQPETSWAESLSQAGVREQILGEFYGAHRDRSTSPFPASTSGFSHVSASRARLGKLNSQ